MEFLFNIPEKSYTLFIDKCRLILSQLILALWDFHYLDLGSPYYNIIFFTHQLLIFNYLQSRLYKLHIFTRNSAETKHFRYFFKKQILLQSSFK